MGSTANTQILANAEYRSPALVWRVVGDGFLQVLAGRRQRAEAEPCPSESMVGDDHERRVVGTLRQAQQCFTEFACGVQLWPYHIKPPQPKQDLDQLWRLAHLLTQRA